MDGMAYIPKDHQDYTFSTNVVKLMMQFIRLDVTKQSSLDFMGQKWPQQEKDEPLQYFNIDLNPKMIPEPTKDMIKFWKSLNIA